MLDGSALVMHSDPHRAIRSLAARHGFNDAHYSGELRQLFDGRGRSLRFLRPKGVSLDRFGEILADAQVTTYRLAPDEIVQLLAATFDSRPSEPKRKEPSARAVRKAVAKASRNRQRKFLCECGQIARASKNTLLVCGLCHELTGSIVRMVRVDATAEELAR